MKAIVTTTINPPTLALERFARTDWHLIVIGDKKTPHHLYEKRRELTYLHPDEQEKKYPKLSKLIGWNCIQRRNIGYLEAIRMGADIIASVDDDNIPDPHWGKNLVVGTKTDVAVYHTNQPVYDPLRPFGYVFWHRGYPLQMLGDKRMHTNVYPEKREIMVEASLWNGQPDIDAIARIAFDDPEITFAEIEPYSSNVMMPFNSQNTFFTREALKDYFLFPHIGRMDDIWGAYIFQHKHPKSVAFTAPSVRQERNPHDFVVDMEKEMIGYKNSLDLILNIENWQGYIPKESVEAYKEYRRYF